MSCNSLRFVGIEDVTIIQGEGIDLESGVEAYDANGDAIPFTVKPDTIEKCDVGTHVVKYSAAGYGGEGGKIHLCGENEAHIPPQCNRDVIVANRTITIEQADPPTIEGIEDISLDVGETFDVMEGVSATDALGNPVPVTWKGIGDDEVQSEYMAAFSTDLAPNDLKSLEVGFEPYQDLSHGVPSPSNVCPISGYTEVQAHLNGVNMWSDRFADYTKPVDYMIFPIKLEIGQTYTISVRNTGEIVTGCVVGIVQDGTQFSDFVFPSVWDFVHSDGMVYPEDFDYTIDSTWTDPKLVVYCSDETQFNELFDNYDIQIKLGATPSTYEPYQGTIHTQQFDQTVYGGTYDFVNGALSVEWDILDLGTLDWHPASASRWFAGVIGIKTDDTVLGNPNHLLSDYYVATQNIVDPSTLTNGQMTQEAGTAVGVIWIKDTAYDGATAEQVKQSMSGRHLAYRVDRTRSIQFEPQQIQTIEEENYVWSEDGSVKVIFTKTFTDEEVTFPTNGYYEITYEAEDECGNKTTAIRQISVEVLRTVLYSDGTFIINETFEDMASNRALYGNEAYTYPPLDAENDYVFRLSTQAPWHRERGLVQKAKIGSPIQPTSTAHWYESMTWLFDVDLTNIDTSNTTSMANMFAYCQNLYEIDLSMFDTSNVTNMFNMFGSCTNLVELDLATFDTSSVTDFRQMFAYCNRLANLNISGFDTSNATNMASMFLYCSGLTSIDLSGFNTAKVVDMTSMFSSCTNLASLDLSSFNTQSVETMKHMFSYCNGLTTLDLSMFITESLTNINAMFDHCSNLETVDMSNFDTSNVRDMAFLFNECRKLTSARLESFDTSMVETMMWMFSNCGSLVELDISNFATPRVTTMANMFNGCTLLELLAICRFETSNVTNMNKMFNRCASLSNIYASDYFVTYNVTDDTDMFLGDTSLVGELGTAYDPNYVGKEYARIDREDTPGYFYGCPDMSE